MKRKNTSPLKAINWWAFTALSAYIIFISWRLFFYAYTDNVRHTMQELNYNLVPFKTIMNFILNTQNISFDVWIYNLGGNVAAFMPLGFLLPAALNSLNRWKDTFRVSFLLIFAAEVVQLVTRRGVFDIDDIILNMVGSMMGYYIYKVIKEKWRGYEDKSI